MSGLFIYDSFRIETLCDKNTNGMVRNRVFSISIRFVFEVSAIRYGVNGIIIEAIKLPLDAIVYGQGFP